MSIPDRDAEQSPFDPDANEAAARAEAANRLRVQLTPVSQGRYYLVVETSGFIIPIGEIAITNPWPRLPQELEPMKNTIAGKLYEAWQAEAQAPMQLTRPGDRVPEPPGWLANPIMVDGGHSGIHGDNGMGKSLVAMSTALSLATGKSFNGVEVKSTPVPTLYLDWEDTDGNWLWRTSEMARKQSIPFGPDLPLRWARGSDLLANMGNRLGALIEKEGFRVIVVDSISRAVNDPTQISEMNVAFAVADGLKARLMVTGHSPRGHPELPYGSRAYQGNLRLDTNILAKPTDQPESGGVIHRWKRSKANGVERKYSSRWFWHFDHQGIWAESLDDEPEPDGMDAQQDLLTALGEGAMTRKELADALGIPTETVRSRLKQLMQKNLVLLDGKRGSANLYRANPVRL